MRTETRWSFQPAKGLTARAIARTIPYFLPVVGLDLADWELITTGGSNVLLSGPTAVLDAALSRLRPHLKGPLHTWTPGATTLSQISAGTLILQDVEVYSPAQQEALLQWLDTATEPIQVITTSDRPLFELVKSGFLLEALFYRLNTVHLDFYEASFIHFRPHHA